LAATNQDLAELVSDGRFREDLYYRLSAFTIFLPPLHARGNDIDLLVHHYVRRFAVEFDRAVPSVPEATLARLRVYPWPGNIRELQNVLKQSLLAAAGSVLAPDFLPPHIGPSGAERPAEAASGGATLQSFVEERLQSGSTNLYEESLRRMERIVLTRVLQHTAGNQVQAARILGITRGSLRTKIRDLGIVIKHTVAGDADDID
jgi:two-component system nitrogen regulation response regulator GlnG